MEKTTVIALFGPAGAGKDYLLKRFLKDYDNLHGIVSHTTRPIRENEQLDIDYHYCDYTEFFNEIRQGNMLEWTKFNNWYYGTSLNALDTNKINIGVFNISGIETLLKENKVKVHPIYISSTPKTRLLRQLTREENPNVDEIIRRYNTDTHDFGYIPFTYSTIINDDDWNEDVDKQFAKIINSL